MFFRGLTAWFNRKFDTAKRWQMRGWSAWLGGHWLNKLRVTGGANAGVHGLEIER